MKQVALQSGQVRIEEVPEPMVCPGEVLVRVCASVVSTGTEMSSTASSPASFLARLAAQPENVRRGWAMVKRDGIAKTLRLIQSTVSSSFPIGYSAAGRVIAVGEGVEGFRVGDRVACAGAGIASHAEVISVPRNLAVSIPEAVSFRDAATTTIGAIALQGVRRAAAQLGETVAVIGLGLIGQLTVQLLKNAGVTVVGIDVDAGRVEHARSSGCALAMTVAESVVSSIQSLTKGFGVDATIITAASATAEPIATAMTITRKKGRVVVVGALPLHIDRSPFYEKEIDFLISCSYGPGRYDMSYEQWGIDYPLPYVRWTENRNMEAYMALLANSKIDCKNLIEKDFPISEAVEAYTYLREHQPRPYSVALIYPGCEFLDVEKTLMSAHRLIHVDRPKRDGAIGIGIIGAGGFLQGTHLPNMKAMPEYYDVRAVCDRSGLVAKNVANAYDIPMITTNPGEVFENNSVDCVMITTRHDTHAQLAIQAMEAGKSVFVEKPLAIDRESLDRIIATVDRHQRPLMVGFNRRFALAIVELKKKLIHRQGPLLLTYRMDAGYLPPDHWVNTSEGGGRIVGEGCHIVDVFRFLIGASPKKWLVGAIRGNGIFSPHDNVSITIEYADGSVATLLYTSLGDSSVGKEYCEAFADRVTYSMNDYRQWSYVGKVTKSKLQDKGHYEELRQFAQWLRGETPSPLPLEEIIETTRLTFDIRDQITHGGAV